VVRLRFVNDTGEFQPMHLHGHVFTLLTKNGLPLSQHGAITVVPSTTPNAISNTPRDHHANCDRSRPSGGRA